jgi:23S rRNA (guanine745-N1)-methyltransferase
MLLRRVGWTGSSAALHAAARRGVSFRCPSCSEPLAPHPPSDEAPDGGSMSLRCAAGHSIDVAKQGHVNLIPSGRRRPSAPKARGDADASIRARRTFFERGHYRQQAQGVAHAVSAALLESESSGSCGSRRAQVLDAGCGEGRYLREIEHQLGDRAQLWGTDLSKLAVRFAAKRQPTASLAVAASHRLPFDDAQFDVVLCVFAPRALSEFFRVLRPGGALIVADAGPRHLDGLKLALYEGRDPPAPVAPADEGDTQATMQLPEPVRTVQETSLANFEAEDARLLLAMTPFFWVASAELQLGLGADAPLQTTIDFAITTYRRRCSSEGGCAK